MSFHDALNIEESEAGARCCRARTDAPKRLEDSPMVFARNARASISNLDDHVALVGVHRHGDWLGRRGVLDRIAHEVRDHLSDTNVVAQRQAGVAWQSYAKPFGSCIGVREESDGVAYDHANIVVVDVERELPGVDRRHVDEVADHSFQVMNLPCDDREGAPQLWLWRQRIIWPQHVDSERERGQWRSQVMGDAAEEGDLRFALTRDRVCHRVEALAHVLKLEGAILLGAGGALALSEPSDSVGEREPRPDHTPAKPQHQGDRDREDHDTEHDAGDVRDVIPLECLLVSGTRVLEVDGDKLFERGKGISFGIGIPDAVGSS
ncbi:MAG: hypothetical protein M3619_00080 [Myxococcota bacterium]|nr:hypothetical protein [Myxococcota bacterium]